MTYTESERATPQKPHNLVSGSCRLEIAHGILAQAPIPATPLPFRVHRNIFEVVKEAVSRELAENVGQEERPAS
ncbi:hypothetical protein CLCR_11019 [Cladophialophora carrionii]|uniref:Uncharacterized protein n=1 Tax=Cladophialophora carrionii TaxID=86049 RepID=A0A1C1CYJ6_9EURO|nr:hypothetical protein CLCR_11019 [Cladophialophora carrionii]